MKTVFLDISTWVNTCVIGAQHYYAHLECGEERKELIYVLDEKTAMRINECDGIVANTTAAYCAGDTSGRFFSWEELVQHAREHWQDEEYFPDASILIKGRAGVCDPQEVFECNDEEFKRKANKLYCRMKRIGGWNHSENEAEMKRIEKNWERLCNQYLGVLWPGCKTIEDDNEKVDSENS